MKSNEETVLVGDKVVLVPYRKEHVEKYHEWMSSEEIRQQTASEPLSIEEEYQMQTSWQEDKDKLTFIILAQPEKKVSTIDDILQSCSMAGDVNLFLSERHNDEDDANTKRGQAASAFDAELEVMIAEPHWRQKGLAAEALSLLIHYASTSPTPDAGSSQLPTSSAYLPLPSDSFLVKVGFDNHPSIRLFEKLGFKEFKRSEVWKEVEMRLVDGGLGLETLPGPSAVLRWILA